MSMIAGRAVAVNRINQSAFGAIPGTPSAEKLYFKSNGVTGSIARIIDETISGNRGMQKAIQGNRDVNGTLAINISPEQIGGWLAHLIGEPSTTGTGPYTHTFSVGSTERAAFILESDLGSALGSDRYLRMLSCRLESLGLKMSPQGFVDCSLEVLGADFSTSATALDATPTDNGHTAFAMAEASIQEGGSAIATVTAFDLNWKNNIDADTFTIGGGGTRGSLPFGLIELSGTLTVLFEDATLMNKGINDTESSLQIDFSRGDGLGSAGNESLSITIPKLTYEATTPAVEGPKGIRQTYRWVAHAASGSELGAQAVLKNALATV